MATSDAVDLAGPASGAGLAPWKAAPFFAVGVTSSGTGQVNITGAPTGKTIVGLDLGANGVILNGNESATTAGLYELTGRSATTAGVAMYFIV